MCFMYIHTHTHTHTQTHKAHTHTHTQSTRPLGAFHWLTVLLTFRKVRGRLTVSIYHVSRSLPTSSWLCALWLGVFQSLCRWSVQCHAILSLYTCPRISLSACLSTLHILSLFQIHAFILSRFLSCRASVCLSAWHASNLSCFLIIFRSVHLSARLRSVR